MTAGKTFVHVLLFECPKCGCPVACALASNESNLEEIDSRKVNVKCACTWEGKPLGVTAKRHLVINWQSPEKPESRTQLFETITEFLLDSGN